MLLTVRALRKTAAFWSSSEISIAEDLKFVSESGSDFIFELMMPSDDAENGGSSDDDDSEAPGLQLMMKPCFC